MQIFCGRVGKGASGFGVVFTEESNGLVDLNESERKELEELKQSVQEADRPRRSDRPSKPNPKYLE